MDNLAAEALMVHWISWLQCCQQNSNRPKILKKKIQHNIRQNNEKVRSKMSQNKLYEKDIRINGKNYDLKVHMI